MANTSPATTTPLSQDATDAVFQKTGETLRLVVIGLIAVAITSITAVALLSYAHRDAKELLAVAGTAVGGLTTLLARVGKVDGT